jgi:hypothetical protein
MARRRFLLGAVLALAPLLAHAQTGIGQPVSVGPYAYAHIAAGATTVVKGTAGILHYICINTPVASDTITVYDNTAASGTKIATVTIPGTITAESPFCLRYDLMFTTGLTVVTFGADDITVAFR